MLVKCTGNVKIGMNAVSFSRCDSGIPKQKEEDKIKNKVRLRKDRKEKFQIGMRLQLNILSVLG